MSAQPFVHLHCHTHYSLLDGANRIPELVERVQAVGMNAVAMTDHGNLYGAIEFYRECTARGINPIIGYEAYVAPTRRDDREARKRGDAGYHLTLLARNATGFKNLIKMASLAFLEGYHYVPRIDKELLADHHEGLICLSGCASGEFSEYILQGKLDEAEKLAAWFHELFGSDFYIEIQNNGLQVQKLCMDGAVDVANRMGLPLVATSDAHYLTQADAPAHDVLLCINTGAKRSDTRRLRYGDGDGKMVDQFFVRDPAGMYELFEPKYHEAVQRTQEIANGVDIKLDFKKRHFPVFTPPAGKTPEDYLRRLCEEGLRQRYGDSPRQEVRDRLEHELGIICRMGFAGYFLIVHDFVRFAVENKIPCSARGSACGALVSYVLGLSHVDPLEYDLLFERFLDPNRSEAPDIDIDFCQDRREEVIAYVKRKYGEMSVAQIATFGTLAARAAIKDVGRVLDVPLERVNQLTAMVPTKLGITIEDALEQSPELRQAYDSDPVAREVIDIARKLEGTNRNLGTHAAGVVIANGPLTDYVPVQRVVRKGEDAGVKKGEAVVVTQWEMGDIEKVGLLKMDFLGLRTLSLVENCLKLIEKTHGRRLDLDAVPLDDRKTYELLQRGDAKGVFQFESDGIRELLKRLKPDNINDIIACTAMYRPGPLQGGMVDTYINCKHGREKAEYAHSVMEEVLRETHSVMVFQEQVMRILNRLGGIELSSAYACIKAISKKNHEIINKRKVDFLKGAQERGVDQDVAQDIFDKIVFFGGYGFNKCVVGETTVVHALSGERTTVADLFTHRRPFVVHALGEDGKLRPRKVTDVMSNGRKPVYELRTRQGKRITATSNHPFRTLNGWTQLGDLKPGDRIATPRRLPVEGSETWPRHELIILGWLLSEGNTCHPTCLYFYNNDPLAIRDFAETAALFPDTVARIDIRQNGRQEVCLSTGRDARFRKGMKPWNAGGTNGLQVAVAVPPVRCGAFRWAASLDLLGRRATQKKIPAAVFRLCDEDLELFLGRLWAGDGFIANEKLRRPFYATSSVELAEGVQVLLLRLGIVSGVHRKNFKYKGGIRPGYTVHLLGEGGCETFLKRIAPHCLGRERQVVLLRDHLATTLRGQVSKDTIPVSVRAWVDEERRRLGLTWMELELRSGVSTRMFPGQPFLGKRGFRRSTIAGLAAFLGSERLARLAESDIYWDEVVSIRPAGTQETYDLTVEEDHNFVADGLIVHNSHSAAYAHVSYQTAYLKAHYTPEFMAALLSSEIEDGNKRNIMVDHIDDSRKMGVDVLPPCVNVSDVEFTVQEGKVVFGLMAIKGFGRSASEDVVRARREGGPFKDLFDFCERTDQRLVNRAAIERLIKAGALDRLGGHRAQLLMALPRAIQAAVERQQDQRLGQGNLFEAFTQSDASAATEALPDVTPWPEADKLKYEKEALDFYFSSHPLAQHEKELQRFASHTCSEVATAQAGAEITLGGILTQVRLMNTKKARNGNTRYLRCKVEDLTGTIECVMWPDDFAKCKEPVADDKVCFVRGTIDERSSRDQPVLLLNRIIGVEQMRREGCGEVWLRLKLDEHGPHVVDSLAAILERTPGSCPVWLCVLDTAGRQSRLRLSRQFNVNPLAFVPAAVEDVLGPGSVKLLAGNGSRPGR